MHTPTVVVVDDASEVRLLVRTRLRLSERLDVVGEAANGREAVGCAAELRPDLMLLDVSMPVMDGLQALPLVLQASPQTRVVMFSGFEEHGLAERALALGAAAFHEKSAPVGDLVDLLVSLAPAADDDSSAPPAAARTPVAPYTTRRPLTVDQHVLDEHLERFREVFEAAAIGMATMTLSGTVVRANAALARLLGRRPDELVGQSYSALTDGDERGLKQVLADIQNESRELVELQHEVVGRSPRLLLRTTFASVRDSEGNALYVFVQAQDVTAEREALEELGRSEERFRLLVAAVEDYAIFMLDPEGRIASWNSGAERSLGYTAAEIIGQHFSVFYPPAVAAAGHPQHELEQAIRDGRYEEEGWRIRKDGTRFWSNVVITAVFDTAGQHVGFAKVTRDTTERRRLEQERQSASGALEAANAELEVLNARLQQAAEDQAQFLAVTAHELRTPVGLLAGSADLLAKHWAELTDEERRETLRAMTSGSTRLRRLVDDLLTASRLQNSALSMRSDRVAIEDIVVSAAATVDRMNGTGSIIVSPLPPAYVLGDHDRLAQAVENLVANALRHGRPPVEVTGCVEDGQVVLRVHDAGAGVSEQMQPRLFQRFATGVSRGGTGLGLFIVRELARAHGGDARYEPGDGASRRHAFVLLLPVAPVDSGDATPTPA